MGRCMRLWEEAQRKFRKINDGARGLKWDWLEWQAWWEDDAWEWIGPGVYSCGQVIFSCLVYSFLSLDLPLGGIPPITVCAYECELLGRVAHWLGYPDY